MFHLLKPQDIIFLLIIVFLFIKKNPKFLVYAGLLCLILSIPLFAFWIFFTAERLIMYAAGFLFASIILFLI